MVIGIGFAKASGFRASPDTGLSLQQLKTFISDCFVLQKSLEKKLSGKISFINIAYGFLGVFGVLFILVGIIIPIVAVSHGHQGHAHNIFGAWIYFVLWLYCAQFIIPSIGKVICYKKTSNTLLQL